MELLLPMAARKLDLSFDIGLEVPPCEFFTPSTYRLLILLVGVTADYDRIRQGNNYAH